MSENYKNYLTNGIYCDIIFIQGKGNLIGRFVIRGKVMDYKDFEFWSMGKLWKLRKEIILGSMYYSDYRNSFGIPEKVCYDFFNGFVDLCFIMESESKDGLTELEDIYNKYDNAVALWDYFYSVEYPFGEFED